MSAKKLWVCYSGLQQNHFGRFELAGTWIDRKAENLKRCYAEQRSVVEITKDGRDGACFSFDPHENVAHVTLDFAAIGQMKGFLRVGRDT